jgi:ribonuclease P protein component
MLPGNDYVIVGREDVLSAPFAQIAAELSRRMRATR